MLVPQSSFSATGDTHVWPAVKNLPGAMYGTKGIYASTKYDRALQNTPVYSPQLVEGGMGVSELVSYLNFTLLLLLLLRHYVRNTQPGVHPPDSTRKPDEHVLDLAIRYAMVRCFPAEGARTLEDPLKLFLKGGAFSDVCMAFEEKKEKEMKWQGDIEEMQNMRNVYDPASHFSSFKEGHTVLLPLVPKWIDKATNLQEGQDVMWKVCRALKYRGQKIDLFRKMREGKEKSERVSVGASERIKQAIVFSIGAAFYAAALGVEDQIAKPLPYISMAVVLSHFRPVLPEREFPQPTKTFLKDVQRTLEGKRVRDGVFGHVDPKATDDLYFFWVDMAFSEGQDKALREKRRGLGQKQWCEEVRKWGKEEEGKAVGLLVGDEAKRDLEQSVERFCTLVEKEEGEEERVRQRKLRQLASDASFATMAWITRVHAIEVFRKKERKSMILKDEKAERWLARVGGMVYMVQAMVAQSPDTMPTLLTDADALKWYASSTLKMEEMKKRSTKYRAKPPQWLYEKSFLRKLGRQMALLRRKLARWVTRGSRQKGIMKGGPNQLKRDMDKRVSDWRSKVFMWNNLSSDSRGATFRDFGKKMRKEYEDLYKKAKIILHMDLSVTNEADARDK